MCIQSTSSSLRIVEDVLEESSSSKLQRQNTFQYRKPCCYAVLTILTTTLLHRIAYHTKSIIPAVHSVALRPID